MELALAEGHIDPGESIVLFNTGAAQKYVEVLPDAAQRLDRHAVDWSKLAAREVPESR
jgi:threonine synthase